MQSPTRTKAIRSAYKKNLKMEMSPLEKGGVMDRGG